MKKTRPYLLLLVIFILISQWFTINLYLTSFGHKQQLLTEIQTSPLIDLVYAKTGFKLSSFHIVGSPKLYGQMIGIPGKPYMVLSSALNEQFTDNEKEYVALHEIGHYTHNHTAREVISFMLLFIIGCFIIRRINLWVIPVVAVILGLTYIQVGTFNEYEADRFALKHITDPQGMITSTSKFKAQQNPKIDDHSITWKLLLRSTPYYQRIEMANQEIESRK